MVELEMTNTKAVILANYVICSPNMFEYVEDFEILEFSNLFSDAHCPLSLTLSCQQLNSHLNPTDNTCATQTERIKNGIVRKGNCL